MENFVIHESEEFLPLEIKEVSSEIIPNKKEEVITNDSFKKEKVKKRPFEIISIISLSLCFFSLALAFILDVTSFSSVILQFVVALIVPSILFIFFLILFIISLTLIFGIYIAQNYGFWPLTWTKDIFNEMIHEIEITQEQIQMFMICRIILISLCVIIIALSIVSKVLASVDVKNSIITKRKMARGRSTASLVLGILGLLVSISAIIIMNSIN